MSAEPPSTQPIVDVAWLTDHFDEVIVCDVRWYLDGRSGLDAYRAGHILGAIFVDLDVALSSPPGEIVGRHPLPTPDHFATELGRLGIPKSSTVVGYDDAGGMVASRLVWMLRVLGEKASVLDGGLAAWSGELQVGDAAREPVNRAAMGWPADTFVDADETAASLTDRGIVVDSRSADRYRGDAAVIDPRPGHVPGAINLPFADNLDEDGRFLERDRLAARFETAGVSEDSIFYCGSGVSACHNLVAAEAAGVGRPRLYVGSWSGWSSNPQRPVAVNEYEAEATFAEIFTRHARVQGDKSAVTLGDRVLTYAELDSRANDLAHQLLDMGVSVDRYVTIAEANTFEFLIACVACWKLGATPQPVSSRLPKLELYAIVELADSPVVIGIEHATRPFLPAGHRAPTRPGEDLPGAPPAAAWKAPTSGGSTGRPKLIVSGDAAVFTTSLQRFASILGTTAHDTTVMPGPLYHNGPLIWSLLSLLSGGSLVLLPRFDAEGTLAAVEATAASSIYLVPTMMQRIWKLRDDVKFAYDLSSLTTAFHLAEPCPPWLKEAWIDWIGPDVLWELYGGTEGMCFTILDGNEWLEHRGSVGRPINGEIRIFSDDGGDVPIGQIGEVWMRASGRDSPAYRYVGATTDNRDGWECLGDMGSLDADGYLYLADRRSDMILVGGANVFPAEVEAALGAYPQVRSSAVIGLPDADKGNAVHAIVEGDDIDEAELRSFLAERLVGYKLPRTFEFVSESLRDDAGKVRRAALRENRLDRPE